jgi:hypothetical protein
MENSEFDSFSVSVGDLRDVSYGYFFNCTFQLTAAGNYSVSAAYPIVKKREEEEGRREKKREKNRGRMIHFDFHFVYHLLLSMQTLAPNSFMPPLQQMRIST